MVEPPFKGCLCGGKTADPEGYCNKCRGKCRPPLLGDNFCIVPSEKEALLCNIGKNMQHPRNDDYGIIWTRMARGRRIQVMIGCDGVGSSSNGNLASKAAAEAASRRIEQMIIEGLFEPRNVLNQAIIAAQRAVLEVPLEKPWAGSDGKPRPPAMTTMMIVIADGEKAYYVYVGDSRIYAIYGDGERCGAQQLSRDDSVMNELLAKGEPREDIVRRLGKKARALTQCLGPLERNQKLVPNFGELDLTNVEAVVIASDGAYFLLHSEDDALTEELAQVYATNRAEAFSFVNDLVTLAKLRGGPETMDNILVGAIFCNQSTPKMPAMPAMPAAAAAQPIEGEI
jgi:serine/threonine protein phosphatase PrpC